MTSVIVGVNDSNVEPDTLKEGKINIFFKLLLLVFHYTLVIHFFYPLNLNLRFPILNEVSRILYELCFGSNR